MSREIRAQRRSCYSLVASRVELFATAVIAHYPVIAASGRGVAADAP